MVLRIGARQRAIAPLLVALLTAPAAAAEPATSFFDGFDSLDLERWYVSDGWSNGDHQVCGWTADQISVSDGLLRVGFAPGDASGKAWRCGEVRTKRALHFGTFEARLKTPSGSGLNAAFFTYTGPTMNQPHDELDFEVLLKDTGKVSIAFHVAGVSTGDVLELPYPSDQDFVQLAMTWAPDRVDIYINNELAHSVTDPALIPTHSQNLFFSLWGTETLTDWMGRFDPPAAPIEMQVDWVGYTAPGEDCHFPESVLCTLGD